jgi:hypothetical protein
MRGGRSFLRNPSPVLTGQQEDVLDLKPFLAKYAYGISLDIMAVNPMIMNSPYFKSQDTDRALFSMLFQRSATSKDDLSRVMWQVMLIRAHQHYLRQQIPGGVSCNAQCLHS